MIRRFFRTADGEYEYSPSDPELINRLRPSITEAYILETNAYYRDIDCYLTEHNDGRTELTAKEPVKRGSDEEKKLLSYGFLSMTIGHGENCGYSMWRFVQHDDPDLRIYTVKTPTDIQKL